MSTIGTITSAASSTPVTRTFEKKSEKAAENTKTTETAKNENTSGVIYEKSDAEETTKTTSKKDNSAIIAKLKADAEQRTSQLRSIVEQMMTKQGAAIGTADDMWRFLAKGDFTVSADVKAELNKMK